MQITSTDKERATWIEAKYHEWFDHWFVQGTFLEWQPTVKICGQMVYYYESKVRRLVGKVTIYDDSN